MYTTLTRFFDACQPFGYPLLACSVLLLAAIFYHGIFVRPVRLHRLMAAAAGNTVRPLALNHPHEPLSQAVLLLLREKDNPALESMLEAKLRTIVNDQRDGLSLIAIITNIAPMLGILGTAWGLVDIFGVFGSPNATASVAGQKYCGVRCLGGTHVPANSASATHSTPMRNSAGREQGRRMRCSAQDTAAVTSADKSASSALPGVQ